MENNDKLKTNIHNAGVGGSSPPITTIHSKGFIFLLNLNFINVLRMCYNSAYTIAIITTRYLLSKNHQTR